MIQIDGRKGGGQILRTALTFSAVKQEPVEIDNIRGSRHSPGLKQQHLKAVKTVQRLTDAETEEVEIGSEKIVFKPRRLEPESFTVNIGTAGSINLLLDTVLPIASQFNEPLRLQVKGGTDVKWSPTSYYYRDVKIPLLRRIGVETEYSVEKTGFYPTGNGGVGLETKVHSIKTENFMDRGRLERFEVYSKASEDLRSQKVADRKADEVERLLKNSYMSREVEKNTEYVESDSTGSSICLKAVYENSVTGFDALGEKGVRAEKIAKNVVQEFKKFHSSEAVVDKHMADQIIPFLCLTGGSVAVPEITPHLETLLETVERFGYSTDFEVQKGRTAVYID